MANVKISQLPAATLPLAKRQRLVRRPDVCNLEQHEQDQEDRIYAHGSGGDTMGGLIWFSICCATAASALSLSTPFAQHHPST